MTTKSGVRFLMRASEDPFFAPNINENGRKKSLSELLKFHKAYKLGQTSLDQQNISKAKHYF